MFHQCMWHHNILSNVNTLDVEQMSVNADDSEAENNPLLLQ